MPFPPKPVHLLSSAERVDWTYDQAQDHVRYVQDDLLDVCRSARYFAAFLDALAEADAAGWMIGEAEGADMRTLLYEIYALVRPHMPWFAGQATVGRGFEAARDLIDVIRHGFTVSHAQRMRTRLQIQTAAALLRAWNADSHARYWDGQLRAGKDAA